MKKLLLLPFIGFPYFLIAQHSPPKKLSPEGYEINIQMRPFKNQMIYLAHYFGNEYPIVDSALLNGRSEAVFKGGKKLPGGIYLVYFPDQSGLVDMLIDKEQRFSINADLSKTNQLVLKFYSSPENERLNFYKHFMAEQSQEIQAAEEQLAYSSNATDSVKWIHKLSDIDKKIQEYREDLIHRNPGTFLSTLLIALRDPILPGSLKIQRNAEDSAAARNFIRKHYWDGVNFWDGRLAYTPFFDEKLDKYFNEVVDQRADSVIYEIDHMMGFAANNEIMSHLLLNKLLYGSMTHHYKWEDTVFIHLFENFIARKSYSWLQEDERKTITERAYLLMGNIKGKQATNIELPGINGKKLSLYNLTSKYVLVSFWDPTCEHCRETLPKLDTIYRQKWKAAGLEIFSVAVETGGTKEDWLNFVNAWHLQDWQNVYNSFVSERELAEAGKNLILQDYDVWYYPTFFLLDKDKNFMAKKLGYKQVFDLVEMILQKKGSDIR